jgi:hypothetical protein
MPLQLAAIASALTVSTEVADVVLSTSGLILGELNRQSDINTENDRRGSLVAKYCQDMFHEVKNVCPHKRGIVAHVTTLPHRMEWRDGGYIGTAEIAGWGYSIYAIYWGWIVNEGDRGFHNWCVHGYQRQSDNCINIDQ